MITTRTEREEPIVAHGSIFERILIGVDVRSKLSFDACRQTARLAEPDTVIEAATVSLFPAAAATALGVDDLAERIDQTAEAALATAQRILGPSAELHRLQGLTVDALLAEAMRTQTTLLTIGAPEHPRLEEIVLGGVAGELLHQTKCSTLLARPAPDETSFPRRIVVGIDGSDESERAYQVARDIAERRNSTLQSLAALGGKHIDFDELAERHPKAGASIAPPVPALVDAATCADLLVVGSRGLHGPRALGSVSERVAHSAPCSVLVVRLNGYA